MRGNLGKITVQIRSCFFVFRGGGTRWRGRRRLCLPRLVEVDAGEEEDQAEHDVHSELKRRREKARWANISRKYGVCESHLELVREEEAAEDGRNYVGNVPRVLLDDVVQELEDGSDDEAAAGADEHGEAEERQHHGRHLDEALGQVRRAVGRVGGQVDDGGNSHPVQVEPELLVEEGLALGPAALEQRLGVDGSAD